MPENIQSLPLWLIIIGIIYLAILLTIGVVRGQEVHFWPPKIGALPSKRKNNTNGVGEKVTTQDLPALIAALKGNIELYKNEVTSLKDSASQATHDAARAAKENNQAGYQLYIERATRIEQQIAVIQRNVIERLEQLQERVRRNNKNENA